MSEKVDFKIGTKEISIRDFLFSLVIAIIIVNLQFFVFDEWQFYVDNVYYKKAFYGIAMQKEFVNSYLFFVWQTAGSEPMAFFTFYLFSKIFDYSTFIHVIDIIFYTLITLFYRKQNVSFIFILFFLLCNYYFLIISISGHRIKIAFCIFFLGIISKSRIQKIILLIVPFFHFQFFTVHLSSLLSVLFDKLKSGKFSKNILLIVIIAPVIIIGLATFSKIWTKFYGRIAFEFIDFFVAVGMTIFYIKIMNIKDFRIKSYLYLICLIIFIVGGFRMNMILFISFIVISSFLSQKKFVLFNFFSSFYLLYKIIDLYYGHYADNLLYGVDDKINIMP